jgi:hypothetical protein
MSSFADRPRTETPIMWLTSWLHKRTPARNSKPRTGRPTAFRPRLEALEGRDVPSTLTVTSPLDDGSPGTLRDDILIAHSGDTIVFDPTTMTGKQVILSGSELYIFTNLTIQGLPAGSVVDGGGLSRVFDVGHGVSVTLTNLTITGGIDQEGGNFDDTTGGMGAGILNSGTLAVQNCKVTGNTVGHVSFFGGGGIYNDVGATLTVTGSTLSGNSAASDGGGIFNAGTLTVTASTLSGNTAGDGGGIYNAVVGFNASATLSISDSTLSRNSAQIEGGGIYNQSRATVMNCTITGNTAGYEGGGIYSAKYGHLAVGSCVFSADTPDSIFGGYTDKKGNTFG